MLINSLSIKPNMYQQSTKKLNDTQSPTIITSTRGNVGASSLELTSNYNKSLIGFTGLKGLFSKEQPSNSDGVKLFTADDLDKMFKGKLVLPGQFYQVLEQNNIKHVGEIPAGMQHLGTKEALETLDNIGNALRILDGTYKFAFPGEKPTKTFGGMAELHLPQLKFKTDKGEILVNKKVGTGCFGNVYDVQVGKDHYAMKLFTHPNRVDVHGAVGEAAFALATSNKGFTDVAEFYCANPKQGWMLSEFLTGKPSPANTTGKTLQKYLKDQNFEASDMYDANLIGGKICDLGGIKYYGHTKNYNSLADKFNDPYASMTAGRKAHSREEFMECLKHPEARAQVARQARGLYDSDLQFDVLTEALKYKESAPVAAFEASEIEDNRKYEFFLNALNVPEARTEAAKMLGAIPEDQRKEAFYQAWKYPECRPMISKEVHKFSNDDKKELANFIMNNDDAGAKVAYLSLKNNLSSQEKQVKQESMTEYFKQFGLELVS